MGEERHAGRHAVVIGAGIGGLLAARVLTEHFDRVTVLDRDRLPDVADHRAGVPQSRHVHGLLPRGAQIVEELFPGVMEELRADGAAPVERLESLKVVTPKGLLPLRGVPNWARSGAPIYSRFLLEWRLRTRLSADDRVSVLPGLEVLGLVGTDAGPGPGDVRGVRVRPRSGAETPDEDGATPNHADADRGERVIEADLVVDAGGRSSRSPRWLAELGYGEVAEETLHSRISYASRFYERPADFPTDFQLVIVNARPPHNRVAGLVSEIERGMWHVTVGAMDGGSAPTDEEGFLRQARELPDPSLYEAIRVAKPLTPIRNWGTPTNRLRHFERLRRWPAGLITTGDAVCALNPIYGQGMTVAAMDALVLRHCLGADESGRRPGFERRFQRRLAREVATPWLMAGAEDLRWPDMRLDGARPRRGMTLGRAWLDLLLRAAVEDPVLAGRYFELIGFLIPLRGAFTPAVVARVLLAAARRRGRHRETGPGPFALSPEGLARARALPAYPPAAGSDIADTALAGARMRGTDHPGSR